MDNNQTPQSEPPSITSSTPPISNDQPSAVKRKRSFIVSAIVLFFLAIGAAYYLGSQTNKPIRQTQLQPTPITKVKPTTDPTIMDPINYTVTLD